MLANPGQIGSPRGGHGRFLVCAAGSHLDARPVTRGSGHPAGRRRYGAVVVEHRQDQRFQQHRIGEGAFDSQHGRPGKIALTFAVAPDIPGETVIREPAEHLAVHHLGTVQRRQVLIREAEAGQFVQ